MSKTKLNELLQIERDVLGQAEACRRDLMNTFEKKVHHFSKIVKTAKFVDSSLQDKETERLDMQTTVPAELHWLGEKLAKAIDLGNQVDEANTLARADVVLEDGTTILQAVSTTGLLRLEHRLNELKEFVHSIKTLDPAKGFSPDSSEGPGKFKAREEEKVISEKVFDYVVMVPANERHPAQVKELMKDVKKYTLLVQEWSGLLTVSAKGDMIDRVEDLIRAVKKARARANDQSIESTKNKIGKQLLDYVFNNVKPQPTTE